MNRAQAFVRFQGTYERRLLVGETFLVKVYVMPSLYLTTPLKLAKAENAAFDTRAAI